MRDVGCEIGVNRRLLYSREHGIQSREHWYSERTKGGGKIERTKRGGGKMENTGMAGGRHYLQAGEFPGLEDIWYLQQTPDCSSGDKKQQRRRVIWRDIWS